METLKLQDAYSRSIKMRRKKSTQLHFDTREKRDDEFTFWRSNNCPIVRDISSTTLKANEKHTIIYVCNGSTYLNYVHYIVNIHYNCAKNAEDFPREP